MAINAPYTNGAVLASGGRLQVTDQNQVENLNASRLQGKVPTDFVNVGSSYGITQNGKNVAASSVTVANTGVTYTFDVNSTIKIGNVVIKSSDEGKGILVGIIE